MQDPEPRAEPPEPAGSRFEAVLVRTNQALIVALMAVMATLVFVNVVSRYVFNHSIIWVEELTQYQMIWITYLGAGLALREGRHVAVDTLQDLLPPSARQVLRTLVAAAIAAFMLAVTVLGVQITAFTWNQETPVMNVPAGLPYLGVPIGAAMCLLHLFTFWRAFVHRRFETPPDLSGDAAQELAR
jgi:TRAP-type C4-dicarboxylate transport system permease small subunit